MGKKQKFEAVVLSIRIPDEKVRDYSTLLQKIYELKQSVEVYPNVGMAITSFNKNTHEGTLSRFSIIDVGGDWFDVKGFGPASEEDLKKIQIPRNLRPNLISKPIYMDVNEHLISVMTYSVRKSISPLQIEKYFRMIVSLPEVVTEFGAVQVDLFKDSSEIEALLGLETLKEVKIIVKRPNHIPPGLIKEIEEELREENADEMVRIIKSKSENYIKPSARTKAIGFLAAENGSVAVKHEEEGATVLWTQRVSLLLKRS